MKNNHSITTPLFIVTVILAAIASGFLIGSMGRVESQAVRVGNQLNLYPNIETIGVVASGTDLPKTARLMYRQGGTGTWQEGHPLVRIDDGRLVGSLFGLSAATSYDVRVLAGTTEVSDSITTQPDELQFTPSSVLHVNDDAPAGGDGSAAAPFRKIQEAVNRAGPGTQILVADGIYREAVTFPASGNANQWIQVKAAGSGAILDGSKELTGKVWTPHPTKAHVWTATASLFGYLARDQKRFYRYDDLSGLMQSRGHGDVTINEGWYFDANTSRLYIRSQDDPSRHIWQMSQLGHAFDVNGRDWIWIEGFEMRFYGRCGVCTENASHLVIRKNKIHNMLLGVFVNWTGGEDRGNDTRIEYNEIYDPLVNEFPWKATKGSSMEGTAIIVRGHIGAIVRDNEIYNFFNGIYTGTSAAESRENPAVAFDADIYNNYIHDVSDDGLEPEGACVNHRFRNNTIDRMLIGVSLAPITQGPTWVLRSSFTNFTSSPIKWASNSDGIVLFYHNTSWTNAPSLNGMSMITPVHNVTMRNNIFQGTRHAFEEPFSGSTGHDWNYDNWYTPVTSLPHFIWEKRGYQTIQELCTATGLECNGYEDPPGFVNPGSGKFTLLPSSPNIDRGVVIPGINDDFKGSAPDIGAFELAFDPTPTVLSSARADADPTGSASVNFTVTFSESVSGVDISAFKLALSQGISGASIGGVTPASGAIYTVSVNTGTGNGTLRLDVIDNDSIVDSAGQPLAGAGAGNGSFTTGEAYTVDKGVPETIAVSFKSAGTYDGWILESGENTNAGRALDRNATTFNAGDDRRDRQYRSLLSFDTGSLPDNAVIVSAQLKVKRQGGAGADPFGTHGALVLEIRNGPFGSSATLQAVDFSAAASPGTIRDQFAALTSSWYAAQLNNLNLLAINTAGVTQFRLFFSRDDNDDQGADYLKLFSGNSTDANKPELLIEYYIP